MLAARRHFYLRLAVARLLARTAPSVRYFWRGRPDTGRPKRLPSSALIGYPLDTETNPIVITA